ncbi:MAG: putative rane protein [Herbinix sp.]|nr:putative rane protein [Herbinix sp.]
MTKRPLVWLLGAYLLGTILAWQHVLIGIVIVIVLLGFLALYLWRYHKKGLHILKSDRFLWFLPILPLLGFVAMRDQIKLPELYHAFEQEVPCELSGQIKIIVTKQKGQALYVENNLISLSEGEPYPCENVIIYTSTDQIYRIGNRITVQGSLQKFKSASNPGQFNEKLYYQIENIDFKLMAEQVVITDAGYSKYHTFLDSIKSNLIKIYGSILEDREAGTLIAMLLGEKYLLEEEVKQLYQSNGISHVLAISGLHVSLIGMSIFWLLRKCKLPITIATVLTILFIYSYGVLTNFSVSTNRAVVMMIVMLLATIFGKTYDMLSATALSALIILLQNPLQLLSAGFLLSFLAVLGIGVILPLLKLFFTHKNKVIDSLLISISAIAATTPMVLYFFYQYPLYGIITNLIILPFITVLTLSSLLAGFIGILEWRFGVFAIGGANYILKLYDMVCIGILQLPYHVLNVGKPKFYLILLSILLMLSFVWVVRKYKKKLAILLLLASQLILFLPRCNPGLTITMLDVGQGDAIYMESKEGTSFLIDGGSANVGQVGRYRIVPFLKSKGVDRLDYVIITHLDQDHISGLVEIIEEDLFLINCLVLPYLKEKEEKYLDLEEMAAAKNIRLQYITEGNSIHEGPLSINCLHPSIDFVGSTANSYSTVLSVNYGEFDMLLTGDLEDEGERLLIQGFKEGSYRRKWGISPAVDIEVLKVAHHGSKYSTSEELLELLKPEISLISCSRDNWYGHPHPELLDRLVEAGSTDLITYESGAITITTDGEKLEIEEYYFSNRLQ